MKNKSSSTKEKIKLTARILFNEGDTSTITTNHIAKKANISPGNLYYHYKNKEQIIIEIYQDMSAHFESINGFERIALAKNPLREFSLVFDDYGKMFWEYRFLVRDISTLLVIYPELKELFISNQTKRIEQIKSLYLFFMDQGIIEGIDPDTLELRAKLNWFVSSYWHLFTSISQEITHESIGQTKQIIFQFQLMPFLTPKGKEMLPQEFKI